MTASDTLNREQIIDSAKGAFAQHGYPGTAMAAIAAGAGVEVSRLEQEFGSERELFEAALTDYARTFIAPRIAAMAAPGAGPDSIIDFFAGLGGFFLGEPNARLGCLVINAVGDLAGRDPLGDQWGAFFREHLGSALTNACAGFEAPADILERRVQMLVAQTLGVWLLVRVDPAAAAQACQAVIEDLARW